MSDELTRAQRLAVVDVRSALAAEKSGDLPEGLNPVQAAEYWQAYFRLHLEKVAKAFGEVTEP